MFNKALCDLGESINLTTLVSFKKLSLGDPKYTPIKLLIGVPSIKQPVGILLAILVKVDKFILPSDFVVLDCDIDIEV